MYISDKQKDTMHLIGKLLNECGNDRWFTQGELPGVTKHTMDALVSKGFLHVRESETNGMLYYRQVVPETNTEKEMWL